MAHIVWVREVGAVDELGDEPGFATCPDSPRLGRFRQRLRILGWKNALGLSFCLAYGVAKTFPGPQSHLSIPVEGAWPKHGLARGQDMVWPMDVFPPPNTASTRAGSLIQYARYPT